MNNCVSLPSFLLKVENLNCNDKVIYPVIFLSGLKWQVIFSRCKENNVEKIQLFLACLNAPVETLSAYRYSVNVDMEKNGKWISLAFRFYSSKDKEWCVWSNSFDDFQSTYGHFSSYTFLVTINPVAGDTRSIFSSQGSLEDNHASPCVKSIFEDFRQLFKNAEHSDFILNCGERKVYVHKAILCARSEYFAGMLRNDMKEVEEGEARIEGITPDILELVLHYLYTGEIPELCLEDIRRVYTAAERFLVDSLQFKCYLLFTDNIISMPKKDSDDKTKKHEDCAGVKKTELKENKKKQLLRDLLMSREWRLFSEDFPHDAQEMCRPYLLMK